MAEYISSDSCRGCGAEYESIFWLINHAKRINSCREKYTSVELDLLEEKASMLSLENINVFYGNINVFYGKHQCFQWKTV